MEDIDRKQPLGRLVGRAMRRRCPRCGGGPIFTSWFKMAEGCPKCGDHYVREEGYWVGAIIVNTAAVMALFAVVFVGYILVSLPVIEWLPLLLIAAVVNVLFPILFFPYSKTLWVAFDLYFNPDIRSRRKG